MDYDWCSAMTTVRALSVVAKLNNNYLISRSTYSKMVRQPDKV